jgi:hypothetical protein
MRFPRQLLVGFVLSLFMLLSAVHAQSQVSPYTVVVPVKDTTEPVRDQAFGEGLGQVLTRVAGGQDLRSRAGYGDVIKGAPGLVQQYRYQRGAPGVATGLSLSVTFDQAAVQRAVSQMGVASAGVKPPILLVIRGDDNKVLGKDALATLTQTISTRGYGAVLADPEKIGDTPTVSSIDAEEVMALAKQYRTGLMLVGQVHGNTADWNLVSGGPQQRWTTKAADENAMQADAGNNLADRLCQPAFHLACRSDGAPGDHAECAGRRHAVRGQGRPADGCLVGQPHRRRTPVTGRKPRWRRCQPALAALIAGHDLQRIVDAEAMIAPQRSDVVFLA